MLNQNIMAEFLGALLVRGYFGPSDWSDVNIYRIVFKKDLYEVLLAANVGQQN